MSIGTLCKVQTELSERDKFQAKLLRHLQGFCHCCSNKVWALTKIDLLYKMAFSFRNIFCTVLVVSQAGIQSIVKKKIKDPKVYTAQ